MSAVVARELVWAWRCPNCGEGNALAAKWCGNWLCRCPRPGPAVGPSDPADALARIAAADAALEAAQAAALEMLTMNAPPIVRLTAANLAEQQGRFRALRILRGGS